MKQSLESFLFDPEHFRTRRQACLDSARSCKAVLTDPNSYWRYDTTDPRLSEAVGWWVARARKFHDLSTGKTVPHIIRMGGE